MKNKKKARKSSKKAAPEKGRLKESNIYLVGFMGTGKTSVGKELARRKNGILWT